jgi:glyoxylate reductase
MTNGCEVAMTAWWPGEALERLGERCVVRVRREETILTEDELVAFIGGAEAAMTILADPVTDRVLERCPNLKIVANVAVGYNNIDLEAAARRGVWVTNTPDVLTEATADLAWGLVLAVTRRVVEADGFLREGSYTGWRPDLLLGSGLQGKTLGLLGYGRIGRAVARRARASGMHVMFHDPGAITGEAGDRGVELEELLRSSWVLSIHCPLTPSTRRLLNRERFALMRPGAYVVNTARGPVIDEAALVEALEGGHLGGAGLDVYEDEPEVHPGLLRRKDVVLLPHVGSATLEARSAMAGLAADNVVAVLEGREPRTPVARPLADG